MNASSIELGADGLDDLLGIINGDEMMIREPREELAQIQIDNQK